MIRVTGNNSLLMSSLNTDTDNDTKVVDLLKKSSETEKSSKTTGKKSEEYNSVKKSASSLKASATVLAKQERIPFLPRQKKVEIIPM